MFDVKLALRITDEAIKIAKLLTEMRQHIDELVKKCDKAADMANAFIACRDAYGAVDGPRKDILKVNDSLSYERLPDFFQKEGLKTLTTDSGYRVTIGTRFNVSILDGKKDDAFNWLRKNELGALIQETVNAGSLSASIKEMMKEENIDPPESIFKTAIASYASVTKVK